MGGAQRRPAAEERAAPSTVARTGAEGGEPSASDESGPAERAQRPVADHPNDQASAEAPAAGVEVRSQAKPPPAQGMEITLAWLQDSWGELLQAIRPRNRMVEALLKSCEPLSVKDGVVMLGFYHSFHRDKVNEDQHRATVEEALRQLSGQPLRVRCNLIEGDREQKEQERESDRRAKLIDNPVVQTAITRFGARVVDAR